MLAEDGEVLTVIMGLAWEHVRIFTCFRCFVGETVLQKAILLYFLYID
jgi:hypothetical protein